MSRTQDQAGGESHEQRAEHALGGAEARAAWAVAVRRTRPAAADARHERRDETARQEQHERRAGVGPVPARKRLERPSQPAVLGRGDRDLGKVSLTPGFMRRVGGGGVGADVLAIPQVRPEHEQREPRCSQKRKCERRDPRAGQRLGAERYEQRPYEERRGHQHHRGVEARLQREEGARREGRQAKAASAPVVARREDEAERQPLDRDRLQAVHEDGRGGDQHAQAAPGERQARSHAQLAQQQPSEHGHERQRGNQDRGVDERGPRAQGEAERNRQQRLGDERLRAAVGVLVREQDRRLEIASGGVQQARDVELQQRAVQQGVGVVMAARHDAAVRIRRQPGDQDRRRQSQQQEREREAASPHRPAIGAPGASAARSRPWPAANSPGRETGRRPLMGASPQIARTAAASGASPSS